MPVTFQNHYGWIETYSLFVKNQVVSMFQNHYGWIETGSLDIATRDVYLFQNHYGWIETEVSCVHFFRLYRFKTTTVGLRLALFLITQEEEKVSKPLRLD